MVVTAHSTLEADQFDPTAFKIHSQNTTSIHFASPSLSYELLHQNFCSKYMKTFNIL